jgi:16S rRNA processing protein RimM
VTFVSDRPERTEVGATLVLEPRDGAGDARALVIATSRPHQGKWLVRFEGIDDRTAAEALRGCVLTAEPLPSTTPAPDGGDAADVLWVHELVGARVVDTHGTDRGTVVAIQANPAHDLLVLEGGALVPVTFVTEHDSSTVVVDVPDGLFEL